MLNSVHYQGRLTSDVELRYTASNVAYALFTIAWSEKYKEVETKCFLYCKAWRTTAEFISKYFGKGTMIMIEGHLVTEEWEKDGEKRSRVVCQIDKAHFCGSKTDNATHAAPPAPPTPAPMDDGFMNIPDGIDEELPFT